MRGKNPFFVVLCFAALLGLLIPNQSFAFDPFDDNDPETNSETDRAGDSIVSIIESFHAGNDIEDIEHAELQRSLEVWAQYKFDEVAQKLLDTTASIIRELPNLYQHASDKNTCIRNASLILEQFYLNLRKIGNKSDSAALEQDFAALSDYIAFLKKKGLLDSQGEAMISKSLYALLDTITQVDKIPYQRNKLINAEGNQNPLITGKEYTTRLINSSMALATTGAEKELGIKYLEVFRARIQEKAKGQPELENALVRMELRRIMNIDREEESPEKVWALGIEGVGKDTYAYALVEAKHPADPNARLNHMFRIDACRTEADTSRFFGANPQYINAWEITELIKFAVKHSGGKYHMEKIHRATNV